MEHRKSPEVQPDVPGSDWLRMPDAARLLGISERAARDWLKRHDIPQRGSRPMLVEHAALFAAMEADGRSPRKSPEALPGTCGSESEPIEARYRMADGSDSVALVPLPALLGQVNTLTARLDAMAQRNEALALEVGQLRERTTQQASTLGRVEVERDQLQARVKELETKPAAQVMGELATRPAFQPIAPTPAADTAAIEAERDALRSRVGELEQITGGWLATAPTEPQRPVRRAWWQFWRP